MVLGNAYYVTYIHTFFALNEIRNQGLEWLNTRSIGDCPLQSWGEK